MALKEISVSELQLNPMDLIGKDWMLITAGNETSGYNTMTAAWGHLGSIWHLPGRPSVLPTACIYVRPQRYTRQFLDREDTFTLSFFDERYKKQLSYLGSVSGRDENKIEKAGLTPVFGEETTWFAEAKLVLVCRKLYRHEMAEECFTNPDLISRNYPEKDFHIMYLGEIVKVLAEE